MWKILGYNSGIVYAITKDARILFAKDAGIPPANQTQLGVVARSCDAL